MSPPSASSALHLIIQTNPFFVVQLEPAIPLPAEIANVLVSKSDIFISVTRTKDEISIVGEVYAGLPEEYNKFGTWTAIQIQGPMEHGLVGVMAAFTAPLKDAKVPVFAISTWNTDYVLVPSALIQQATSALETDGWIFVTK
ncbi:hypothetical protein FA15DRAFT_600535 [Coprinopsis marcescibilis]|uniref:CASTOR ACT domain-containing protein n=1 Tax=Coprinopsis marcescibilis TaxID=230819 RepID=A0A5C3KIT1_COPMA|nr:hypothetical protein FA15DRAFT_600535 [Coprinopsis marcescibilis]